jgi:1-phosphatidylinositol-4-phosphate 5-kinase
VRAKVSNDAYLRPPQARPKRRNTISTSIPLQSFPCEDIHAEGELATKIQQQQEQLIRERQTKRAKAQQQEAASKDPEKPLVGHWIREGHQNYVLMYNMLTGIRIAVRLSETDEFACGVFSLFVSGVSMSSKGESRFHPRGLHSRP